MHLLHSLPLLVLLAGRLDGITIGTDVFDYPNGAIAGRAGGTGFDRDLFDNEATGVFSDWDNVTANPAVAAGALTTNGSGAKREYNGTVEETGGPANDGQNNHERSGAVRGVGRVFYRIDLTRGGNATWSGVSSYDFDTERLFFGVPNGDGPSGGREFGVQVSGVGGAIYFSGILANTTAHTLVAVLDFDRDFVGIWVDPDGSDFYNEVTGSHSADAGGAYTGTNWSTAVRLASGGQVSWDNLSVATKWTDLGYIDPNDTDGDGMADSWEAAHGLVVGTDDALLDADDDDLLNLDEFLRDTDPQVEDTDDDGFGDGAEVAAGTNPKNAASYPGAVLPEDVVGSERFAYADGPIAGKSGGLYWDYDNSSEDDAFTGHSGSPSDWDAAFGNPVVSGEALITQNSGAKREYNGPTEGNQADSDERAGAVNGLETFGSGVVYYKFDITRGANVEWSGASTYDFAAERYLFGIPGAANPASGNREFAIHDLNAGQWAYSGIAPVTGQTYTLVAKLDFDNDVAALYLDPDLGAAEGLNTPVAIYPHTSDNWSSSIRLASGGSGPVTWDNLRVAYAWSGLEDGPPVAHDDSVTMHHLAKARLKVLANDNGGIATASVTILTPPLHGSAIAHADGTILYHHLTGTPGSDTFTYRIESPDAAFSDIGTVIANFTAAPRFDTDFVSLPPVPPAGALRVEDAFPGITFDSPHGFSTIPGDARKLFVAEGDGRIFLIPDMAAPQKIQILDISAAVQHDNNELAMKGIAAHPQWASNGYIYLSYNTSVGSVRLSRFTCQTSAPYTAGSELILIEQNCDDTIHNIGTCEFGPDGYLYVGFGDEGTQEDGRNNSQHIDRNLWSCVIRIDVDKRPGSLPPNPDPGTDPYAGPDPGGQSNDADLAIPRIGGGASGEARYAIPPDNPLLGATSFNGTTLTADQVRTEIFAMGVRNPWQFSPEDTDGNGTVDELWVGDVGRNGMEEVDLFHPGDNGGWGWREGSQPGVRNGDNLNGAPESAATLTGPLWEYGHGGGSFQGASITGGFIYRGTALPDLTGKYICVDYVSGNIWSIARTEGVPTVERIAGEVAIVGLLPDPATGDILLLDRGNTGGAQGTGGIKRLTLGTDDSSFPPTLSRTNFFADLGDLTPNPGGHFYEPNLRFWSDHAEKKRWFLINSSADTVGYQQDAPWTYPAGMIWVKHFDYPTQWESFTRSIDGQNFTDRRPVAGSPRRRLETRFLVRNETGSYGISYHWNNVNSGTQTDAALADDDGETFGIDITLDGNPSAATWQIPSRTNCMTCHTPEAGHALSFNTRQMNAPGTLSGNPGNMISLLGDAGYLANPPEDPASLARHVRPDESGESLEARVRSYLAVNCAYCHQAGGTGGGNWDGRAHLSLAQTGLINGATVDAPLHPGDLLIVPGDVPKSIIYNRVAAANGYTRMPPLASDVVDLEGAQLIADWIGQAGQPPFGSYQEWRIARFGNGTSPEGAAGENPDGDKLDNFGEWAFGTNPQAADDVRSATALLLVEPGAGEFRFTHRRLQAHEAAGIDYAYRIGDNLTDWADATVIEESAVAIPGDPGYEMVTLSLAPGQLAGKSKLFLQVVASP
ncbi:PQQ-dependent sugar dehydrogenase [Luteolibacter sp. Populi]|uniref:PQQ-dependent sugar dehydrogenase n=1 Tax=Luteolibacter sp. Populi TaxID=3230487 RepID=UPI003465147E